ncbi:MAG TPA: glycosyltransferase family 1 protein [Candidatus Saccharimonadales bacterium]|jgi:glycosyltransferase involved in cell wall biosynthesis|nr:glycosyltransferase family 1 protein [Candidatus Saccharimonadales bacterium]
MKAEYFVYVGNAYPHKNLVRLIQAIVFMNKKMNTKIELKIASSRNVFTQRLQSEIDSQNAGKYVTLLGFVSDNELVSLYKNTIGFVFPSLSEGFGLPGIEAMRAETLVLASDIPVFKEIYKDNAIYFDPLDFTSIEKAMEDVMNMDTHLREEKIGKAKNFVKSYSWAKMARETLNIYESCNSLRSGK